MEGFFLFFLFTVVVILIVYTILKAKKVTKYKSRKPKRKHKLTDEEKGKIGELKVEKRLDNGDKEFEHREINNLILVDNYGNSHQIDHIEIRENGIFCIETKNYSGYIFGSSNQRYWTQCLSKNRKYRILNPLFQNNTHVREIERVLHNKYKVNSLVVMVQNNANKINAYNVINLGFLNEYLIDYDDGTQLSSDEIDEIYNTLLDAESGLTNKEHLDNLRSRGYADSYDKDDD